MTTTIDESAAAADAAIAREKEKPLTARFKAKYLHALRLILDEAEEGSLMRGVGLLIEPALDGGVLLIATDGRALAVIHDATGHASRPFRALLPKRFRERCAPAKPLEVFLEGEDAIELPEWAQPGDVHLFDICAVLFPQMNHPDIGDDFDAPALANVRAAGGETWRREDYRLDDRPLLDWRKPFSESTTDTVPHAHLSPSLFAVFHPFRELGANEHHGFLPGLALKFGEGTAPAIVKIEALPNFIGAITPLRAFDVPPGLPDFIRRPVQPATSEESK